MAHSTLHPVVLAGAFERHNLGDMVMERIADWFAVRSGLMPIPASVIAADLRCCGGCRTHAFSVLAPHLPPQTPILHVGGETIPCTIEGALRMDIPASWPPALASHLAKSPIPTGLNTRRFAYLTPPAENIHGTPREWPNRFFHALGASSLAGCDPSIQQSIKDDLLSARWLTAREDVSVSALQQAGLSRARFAWDTAVLQPVLGPQGLGALEEQPRPQSDGPLLVQASADFLHAHAEEFAAALARSAGRSTSIRLTIAGLAAQHDTLESLTGLARSLADRGCSVDVAADPRLCSIIDEIRHASCVVATSLHFRILALTHGAPRVSLANFKTTNWSRLCDPLFPADCSAGAVDDAIADALKVSAPHRQERAMSARREALHSMNELMEQVAACARSVPPANWKPLTDAEQPTWPGSGQSILPREWIDAVGAHVTRLADDRAAAAESGRIAREKVRQLRSELEAKRASRRSRILRWFSSRPNP